MCKGRRRHERVGTVQRAGRHSPIRHLRLRARSRLRRGTWWGSHWFLVDLVEAYCVYIVGMATGANEVSRVEDAT